MNWLYASSWQKVLTNEFEKPYYKKLNAFLSQEYQSKNIHPDHNEIFNAFELCSFDQTKVVILGQDPYHGLNQANGLSFSVNENIGKPPSLVNIFKEIERDLGIPMAKSGSLTRWAKQGVLMINAIMTVRDAEPGSHKNRGWEIFTDAVITALSEKKNNVVFLLWGTYAQAKGNNFDLDRHLVLKSAHPSPLSVYRGFEGNGHFSKTNAYLSSKGLQSIAW